MRIVIDIKRDANANVVLNKLYKFSALQSSFSVKQHCAGKRTPRQLNIKDLIKYFVEHRHEIITRRTEYELKKPKKERTCCKAS